MIDIGLIDTRIGHHETQPMNGDQRIWREPEDLFAFAKHDLNEARILIHHLGIF